ncbi:MAG: MBL fold metallo-hydrolase [Candidatus Nanoarchaeia archaeon]|nr:MBL fold metallo-hydrolase [Candidatus Nanoarchaeia archaeon]
MSVTIIPLGGFGEIGRNSLALDIDGKILIIDFGFHLERYLEVLAKRKTQFNPSLKLLKKAEVLPDLTRLKGRKRDLVGIICSHAHLDHIGGLQYLANKFSCKIHATPFTASVIRSLAEKNNKTTSLEIHPCNSSFNISGINVDFIPVAHSTPDAVIIAIHTSAGVIMYANDFKLDQTPVIGNKTNLDLLKKYSGKVKLLCMDCLYSSQKGHCESEETTRKELLSLKLKNYRAIFATSFSSHIARIKTFCDMAKKLNRKIIFAGSSLSRYLESAKDVKLIDLISNNTVLKTKQDIYDFFRRLRYPEEYFFIVTGHQGEPNSTMMKLIEGEFKFSSQDLVIFSNKIIPSEVCIQNREYLEKKLSQDKVHQIKDIHVSGHLFQEDHKKVVSMLKPEYLWPSHGEPLMMENMNDVFLKEGFKREKILMLKTGDKFNL